MFRAFLLPMILMGIIGMPMLYSNHQRHTARHQNGSVRPPGNNAPWQPASYRNDNVNITIGPSSGTRANSHGMRAPFSSGASLGTPNLATAVGQSPPTLHRSIPTSFPQATNATVPGTTNVEFGRPSSIVQQSVPFSTVAVTQPLPGQPLPGTFDQAWAQPGMVPDFAKAETVVFPGDANGPDLSAAPMSFTPTIDLSTLFRFDITKQWITSRWDRVSTSPADQGLHGMRVALVTGTNSWDLHGSLTYYFDATHRVQRITYRGWTGDASRLVQTLQQQVQIRAQPTHWAGLYLSKRSGLLMKHPSVIDKSNPVQQLALILEINNPAGKTPLSNDFQSLLPAAMATR